ncbi:carbamoyltransferase HypF, partial [Streptomyces prasinus]
GEVGGGGRGGFRAPASLLPGPGGGGRGGPAPRGATGLRTVALTGGVFSNTLLSTACARALRTDGFTVLRHREVPPNDGGLALGQMVVGARARAGTE